jgi:hypothetical protein
MFEISCNVISTFAAFNRNGTDGEITVVIFVVDIDDSSDDDEEELKR